MIKKKSENKIKSFETFREIRKNIIDRLLTIIHTYFDHYAQRISRLETDNHLRFVERKIRRHSKRSVLQVH